MRLVADIAKQRGTTVADVLAHLRRAGVALAEGQLEVDEEVVDKAYTQSPGGAAPGAARRRRQPPPTRRDRRSGVAPRSRTAVRPPRPP